MTDPRVRRWGALAAALAGGYLMYVALDTTTDAGTSVWTFLLGLALWVVIAAVLLRFYAPGAEAFSAGEVGVAPEWRVARFLRLGADAAPLYLGVRLFLGYQWLHAGWGKLTNPAWVETGTALQSYWTRAVAVPASGSPPVAYPAYRALLQHMLDNEWYTWFAKLIVAGELLVGLGLLLGGPDRDRRLRRPLAELLLHVRRLGLQQPHPDPAGGADPLRLAHRRLVGAGPLPAALAGHPLGPAGAGGAREAAVPGEETPPVQARPA